MNIRVASVEVAERLLESAMSGLEDEPGVSRRTQLLPSNRHSEFARHIEPGSRWRIPVDLHSGEVVDGVAAALDQSKNPLETTLAAGDAEGGSRLKTELAQSDDIGQIETTEPIVIGNIQKNSIWLDWRNRHGISDLDHFLVLKTVAFSRMVPDASR
jgi:hypothetical protein